jgi:hypothetical protein
MKVGLLPFVLTFASRTLNPSGFTRSTPFREVFSEPSRRSGFCPLSVLFSEGRGFRVHSQLGLLSDPLHFSAFTLLGGRYLWILLRREGGARSRPLVCGGLEIGRDGLSCGSGRSSRHCLSGGFARRKKVWHCLVLIEERLPSSTALGQILQAYSVLLNSSLAFVFSGLYPAKESLILLVPVRERLPSFTAHEQF